jgi:FkbM family methyltransferase
VDVGAHNGDISDFLLECAPHGEHVLFEPLPQNAAFLRHKYRRAQNIRVVEAALSDREGATTFNYNVAHPATSGIRQQTYFTEGNRIELINVPMARMDDEISAPVNFIKIDVEGAELLVLNGARETIARSKPLIIFEHGPHAASHYGYGAGEVFDYFASLTYGVYLLQDLVNGRGPITRETMVQLHEQAKEWYFVGAPLAITMTGRAPGSVAGM